MLQIKDIRKQYITGDLVQTALDGVSLTLRDNEFVAILGPSGSGKTTLLNVIGGLDRCDSGDLVINGISTKKYSDRDWDSYRNHTIGFVFQSYNLIPHQTVLANVELALTISGISRSERRKRAKKALEDVGLGDQLHKKPNQMSGGQMQRVAIARALVNNPDILLADEPTGALDSDTSVQIMDLLKEVARDRLVVMVTHNPELAEEYANRIVRVRDGKIIGDSNPYSVDADALEPPKHKNMGKASMSFFTALALSFNNLKTKKARTLLTAFAGSIGIIGIALIMSLSTGFQLYIDKIQEDTLSNYPLSIQSETADMAAAMAAFGSSMAEAAEAEDGVVVEQPMITQMFAQIGSNDLASFKTHMEENMDRIADTINTVKYSYGVKPLIFSADTTDSILQVNPGAVFGAATGSSAMSAYMDSDVFHEMIDNMALLDSQYEVLQGRWPESYDELVVVLSAPHQITDYMAYTLGMKDPDGLQKMIQQAMSGQEVEEEDAGPLRWTYDDLMALEFKLVPAHRKYRYNTDYKVWEDMSSDKAYMDGVIGKGETLKIVGIVTAREGVSATTLSAGIAYRSDLTAHVIDEAKDALIVRNQIADPEINVFTGKGFAEEKPKEELNFQEMISVDTEMLSSAFDMDVDTDAIIRMLERHMAGLGDSLASVQNKAAKAFTDTLRDLAADMLRSYIAANADPETGIAQLSMADAQSMVSDYLAGEFASEKLSALAKKYSVTADVLRQVCDPLLLGMVTGYIAAEMPETPAEDGESDNTVTVPGTDITLDLAQYNAPITADRVDGLVEEFINSPVIQGAGAVMGTSMSTDAMRRKIEQKLASFGDVLMGYMGSAVTVDEEKIAGAFQFNMNEEELRRLMEAMSGQQKEVTAEGNLRSLGYADTAKPLSISVYFVDFAAKETFLEFLDGYNEDMAQAGKEDQVISYTDITGIMMSSVRTIIDSVSYVLIAFVAVSLVVSSIMIGIITYISVMERTKEIGVLRAIGASKRNISQVFNAETFIIGLCSGLLGVGITLILNYPINMIIYHLTDNPNINAQLPAVSGMILVALSLVLTIIGGLIPSRQAAKKDPVIALRTE